MTDIKDLLGEYSCVIKADNRIIATYTSMGVKPLMDFYKANGEAYKNLTVIDRIMGKGAVMLAVLVGASRVTTPIMSQSAYDFAKRKGLEVQVDKVVPMIINRQGTGRCPIEKAVLDIEDIDQGYKAISNAIAVLMNQPK